MLGIEPRASAYARQMLPDCILSLLSWREILTQERGIPEADRSRSRQELGFMGNIMETSMKNTDFNIY